MLVTDLLVQKCARLVRWVRMLLNFPKWIEQLFHPVKKLNEKIQSIKFDKAMNFEDLSYLTEHDNS